MTRRTPKPDADLDLVLERTVDVAPELVWRAWTNPEDLKKWFTPAPWRTTECDIDLRPGGVFRTVMEGPAGERNDNEGCYLEVVPNERLVFTGLLLRDYRPANVGAEDVVFTAIIALEKAGKGTKYTAHVMHRDVAGRKTHEEMGFHMGWGMALDQLVALARTW